MNIDFACFHTILTQKNYLVQNQYIKLRHELAVRVYCEVMALEFLRRG